MAKIREKANKITKIRKKYKQNHKKYPPVDKNSILPGYSTTIAGLDFGKMPDLFMSFS